MADEPNTPPAPASDPAGTKKKVSLAPRQGATMGEKQAAQQSAPPPAPAVDHALLAALSQALGAQAIPPPAAPAPTAAERTLIAREEKRFRRAATTPVGEAPPPAVEPTPVPASTPAPATKPAAAADELPVAKPLAETSPEGELEEARKDAERGVHLKSKEVPAAPIPSTGQLWRRLPRERRALFVTIAVALIACVGTFFLGRATAPASPAGAAAGPAGPAATGGASPVTRAARLAEPAEVARVDAALQAMTVNDLPRAEAALLQIQKDFPEVPGTLLTLALLEMQRGNNPKSDHYISLGLSLGEPAGPYYELRSSLASRTNQRARAEEALQQAVRADPYSWKYLYRYAEFLRRFGRNEAALEKLDLAIARVHEQAEEDMMQFKRALILIALGRGAEIDAELARRSAENPPAGEWLLVGLAREAARGNMQAAAGWLQRAIKQQPAAWLSEQLRDFYLNQWCYEKELAALYRPFLLRAGSPARSPEGSVAAPDADAAAAQARAQSRSPLTAPAQPLPDAASSPPASTPAASQAPKPAGDAPSASPSPTPPLDLSNLLPPPK